MTQRMAELATNTPSQFIDEQSEYETAERQRVRITYAKEESIKFISHQDEFRAWERALRRADLPLLYKQGFNPQPHIQFACPLGVGFTGVAEIVDVTFSPRIPLEEFKTRIAASLPPGLHIQSAEEVPLKTKALQGLLIGADYSIIIFAGPDELAGGAIQDAIGRLLASSTIWRHRQRKGKVYRYNLRPLVFQLHYGGYDTTSEEHSIQLRVQQRPGATGRPDEVVDTLGFADYARTLQRRQLYFAHIADHVNLFAQYPVVSQNEIAAPVQNARPVRSGHDQPQRPHAGRTIADRAADEFA